MPQTAEAQTHAFVPSYYDDLDGSLDHAWSLIGRGAHDRRSPFHTPTLATVGAGGAPEARTVVLRGASRETATLRFHTDLRSHKPAQLVHDPRCSVHVYDQAAKIQLRLRGRAALHGEGDVADLAWSGSQPRSRICYAQASGPGVTLASPADLAAQPALDGPDARANFAVILVTVEEIEWLYLSHLGHRRALWSRDGATWDGTWLAP